MTDEQDNNVKSILDDPRIRDLSDTSEIPEELLENLDSDDLTKIFVEQMIVDKGVNATDELRAKLKAEIDRRVSKEILASFPDYMKAQVEQGVKDGSLSDEEFDKKIDEAGIDVETITENTMISFRNEYLSKEEA